MSETLRIALTNPDLSWPRGAQRQVIMLAREWRKLGHEVAIVVGEKATPYAFDDLLKGLDVQTTGKWHADLGVVNKLPGSGLLRAMSAERALRKVATALRAWKPDVVNAHNHPAQWTAGMTAAPHVWTCNEPPLWHYYPTARNKRVDPWMQKLDAKRSSKVRAITVLDSRLAKIVERGYPGIRVHRTGSGCELPGPLPPRAPHEGFRVLSVLGGLSEQKRPRDVVRAAVAARVPGASVDLVGADTDGLVPTLVADALAGGVELRHHAKVSEAQLLQLYADADAALFVPENQPWGIFPLEALLAGVPAVVSDETGSGEVLPARYPFVAKVGDAETAGAHLRRIAEDPASAAAPVREAADVLRREHSWEGCAKRVLAVLSTATRA